MPDPLLTLLKYVFLALLYLFFLRVLRAVWIELREPKPTPLPAQPAPAPAAAAAPTAPVGKPGPERLVVTDPREWKGLEFPIADEMTVGRAPGCGVSLPDDTFISQLHARLFRRDGEVFVEDLGSTNGTFLNDNKVSSAVPIRRGEKVRFGRTTLELRK